MNTDATETCAEDTHSPASLLLADLRAEVGCTWAGYLPDGTLRPNGLWLAELEARVENGARTIARLESRLRYSVVGALMGGVLCGWVAGLWRAYG